MAIAAIAIAGAVISAGSALKGASDSKRSASAIKSAGKQQAKAIGEEGKESERRLKRMQQYEYSESRARAFASNLQMSGSTDLFLSDMRAEQNREVDWLRRETAARMESARKGATTQASNLRRTANTNMMASLGSLAMRVGAQ